MQEQAIPLAAVTELIDALQCGAVVINRSGLIKSVNTRAAEMFGLPRKRLEGRKLEELYFDADGRAIVQRILANFDQPRETESYVPQPDGSRLPVIVAGRPVGTAAPLADFRLYTLIDISKLKQTEASLQERFADIAKLSDTVLEQALSLKDYSKTLEKRVAERTHELLEANMDAIYMLAVASEAKDMDTGAHVRRIRFFAERLARELGLEEQEAVRIGYSATLHDVGKIHVADRILHKEGKLNHREWRAMREHTIVGERILADKPFFAMARQIARSHHENWDGSGYPDGLKGEAIPLPARIVGLVDVYDALLSSRPYKEAWSPEETVRAIEAGSGKQFDPRLVEAFLKLAERGEITQEAAERAATRG